MAYLKDLDVANRIVLRVRSDFFGLKSTLDLIVKSHTHYIRLLSVSDPGGYSRNAVKKWNASKKLRMISEPPIPRLMVRLISIFQSIT